MWFSIFQQLHCILYYMSTWFRGEKPAIFLLTSVIFLRLFFVKKYSWLFVEESFQMINVKDGRWLVSASCRTTIFFYLWFSHSLVGAVYDSIDLIDEAVQSAVNYNALGILITDWSAYGSVTPIEASMSAFAVGAALSWNSKMKQVRWTSVKCVVCVIILSFLVRCPSNYWVKYLPASEYYLLKMGKSYLLFFSF